MLAFELDHGPRLYDAPLRPEREQEPSALPAREPTPWRHRRTARIGGWMMLGGGAAAVAGGFTAFVCGYGMPPGNCRVGSVIMVGGVIGGGAFVAGTGMLFYGGVAGANELDVSSAPGWIGAGLTGSALLLPFVNLGFIGLSPIIALGGLGCGVVQIAMNNRRSREPRVWIAPTGDGVRVAGRF